MARRTNAVDLRHEHDAARPAAMGCTACPLYREATQTVFGAGPVPSKVMLVGEQPGDHEDKEGRPFVGPAGRVLREAMASIGRDIDEVYVTNAVKHFKWEARGKARIHKKPNTSEITACHPWLEVELATVQPEIVVALGATAGRAVCGRPVRVNAERGRVVASDGLPTWLLTVHPSAILRVRDRDDRLALQRSFARDLNVAFTHVG